MKKIPSANFAVIAASSTFALQFPEELRLTGLTVVEDDLIFETPFGLSLPFKLIEVGEDHGCRALVAKMHGWRSGLARQEAFLQLFHVLKQAGVRKIIAEGGVGALNPFLKPRDLILPHDFIDFTRRGEANLFHDQLVKARNSICSEVHETLLEATRSGEQCRTFERGVYAALDATHFETSDESLFALREWGADVVGLGLAPEIYLARGIGACYAGIYMVVDYAAGGAIPWLPEDLTQALFEEAERIGYVVAAALRNLDASQDTCHCHT